MFKIELVDRNGLTHYISYDPHTSTLYDENGVNLVQNIKEHNYEVATRVSPENPGKKSKKLKKIKIQLGLGCNYSCSYCNQQKEVKYSSKTNIRDAEIFMNNIDRWLEGEPDKIEFWGGEPLLYWNKVKFLLEKLSEKFPKTEFLITSNGSLITEEIIEYVQKYNIIFVISHDGPGQHLRGPDPFEDKKQFNMINKLQKLRRGRMSFNAVLTPDNFDIEKIVEFFKKKFDDENVSVNLVGIVYHTEGSKPFTKEQYDKLTNNVALAAMKPKENILPVLNNAINSFVNSIATQRPSSSLYQGCLMDKEDVITVDLLGNVMTCQDTGDLGKHRIGNVQDFDNIKLNTAWHWSNRKECSECPVLQLCAGACMFMEGENWYHTCNNHYYYYIGILGAAIYRMTGMVVSGVYGKIRRPDPEEYGIKEIDFTHTEMKD